MCTGTISFGAIMSSSVQWMNFYVDGNYLASSPPSAILWDSTSVPDGAHTLSVKGFGASSNLLANPAVSIVVDNVPTVPSPTTTQISTTTATPTAKATTSASPTPSASPSPAGDPLRPVKRYSQRSASLPPRNSAPSISASARAEASTIAVTCKMSMDSSPAPPPRSSSKSPTNGVPAAPSSNPLDGETYSFRDLLKAVAVNETNWYEWKTATLTSPDPVTGLMTLTPSHGDLEHVTPTQPNGGSWGLFQIAEGAAQGWPASFPLSATSTGFNADFKAAEQMGVEQGNLSYLGDADRSITAITNGFAPYVDYTDSEGVVHPASTDVNQRRWGAVGNWYSGGWYDSGAISYIEAVQQILHNQPWTQAGF